MKRLDTGSMVSFIMRKGKGSAFEGSHSRLRSMYHGYLDERLEAHPPSFMGIVKVAIPKLHALLAKEGYVDYSTNRYEVDLVKGVTLREHRYTNAKTICILVEERRIDIEDFGTARSEEMKRYALPLLALAESYRDLYYPRPVCL